MQKRLSQIDSLKFIAMILIFSAHFGGNGSIAKNGMHGVELFYMISGFIACYHPPDSESIYDRFGWFIKKYLRTIPLAIIFYIVSFCFTLVPPNIFPQWFYYQHENINLINFLLSISPINFVLLFSVNKFLETYIFVNFLYALLGKRLRNFENKIYICTASVVIMLLLLIIYPKAQNLSNLYILLDYRFRGIYSFFLGSIIYDIYNAISNFHDIYHISSKLSKKCANALQCFILVCYTLLCHSYYDYNGIIISVIFSFYLLCSLINCSSIFTNKLFSYFGRYSYAFYYIHIPIVYLLRIWFRHMIAAPLGFILSLFLSIIITKFIEKPIVDALVIGFNRLSARFHF